MIGAMFTPTETQIRKRVSEREDLADLEITLFWNRFVVCRKGVIKIRITFGLGLE